LRIKEQETHLTLQEHNDDDDDDDINNQQIAFQLYDVAYSLYSHYHVSAGSLAFLMVMILKRNCS